MQWSQKFILRLHFLYFNKRSNSILNLLKKKILKKVFFKKNSMNTTFFPKKIFSFTTYFEQRHRTMVFLKNHNERYVAKMFFYWRKKLYLQRKKIIHLCF